jgi:RecA-family ATPase
MNETPSVIHTDSIRADAQALLKSMDHCAHETTAATLLAQPHRAISCLVEPFLQKVGLACLAGSSDTGKSALLRQLSIAIAGGETDFLGFPIHSQHRSVIYVSTEDGQEATSYLLHRQASAYTPDRLSGLRFIFEAEAELLPKLHQSLHTQPADLVDAFGGDLKDTQKIRAYLQPWQTLAEQHSCLILFLHHTAKRTEALTPSKNNLLSGQGFEAKMRLVIELRGDVMQPAHRHLCIVKGNYLSAMHKKESYVLRFDETHFLFSRTGERVPFELLVRSADTDDSRSKYEQAKELKDAGKSYSQIAEMMGYASKNSISKLFEKAKKFSWDLSDNAED